MFGSTNAWPTILWKRIVNRVKVKCNYDGIIWGQYWCRASNSMVQDDKGLTDTSTLTDNYDGYYGVFGYMDLL